MRFFLPGLVLVFLGGIIWYFRVPIYYEADWLDSPKTRQEALSGTDDLLSTRFPNPTPQQLRRKVLIAVHGFSATAQQWVRLQQELESDGSIFVSRVTLGGHGLDVEAFKRSTWQEWQQPIQDEYERLVALGYRDISFLGASTGAALIVELLARDYFSGKVIPKSIVLIDSFIIPKNKNLKWVPWLGWLVNNKYDPPDPEVPDQVRYWYRNSPMSTLNQLYRLVVHVTEKLDRGIELDPDMSVSIYQALNDPTSDPEGSVFLFDRLLRANPNGEITLEQVVSKHHVFLSSLGRNPKDWTAEDEVIRFGVVEKIRGLIDPYN